MKRLSPLLALLLGASAPALAKVQVVSSLQDFSSIAQSIGGDRVETFALAKGYQDPHFVDAKPSFIVRLSRAALLIVAGLELEIGYLPPLLDQSRHDKLHPGGKAEYEKGLAAFETRLTEKEKEWDGKMGPYAGTKVVTFHDSWPNFAKHFKLTIAGHVEPKPGIPPTPSHTLEIVNLIKAQKIPLIIVEPYFDTKTPKAIAAQTGAAVLTLYPSVGGVPEIKDYFSLFDVDI